MSYGSHQVQAHRSFSAEHTQPGSTSSSQQHKPTRAMTVNAQMVGRYAAKNATTESHRGRTHSAGQDLNNALKKVC